MFYIIGVAHTVQSKPKGADDSPDQKQFCGCLAAAIERFKPAVVGEEFGNYALRELEETRGTEHVPLTKAIADSFDVEHRFCDPDRQIRASMGYLEGFQLAQGLAGNGFSNAELQDRAYAIEVAKYWPVREKFWLDQLADVKDKDVIFVCGDAHVETFPELLKRNGVNSIAIALGIGLTPRDDEFWKSVMKYLQEHPELRR